MNDFLIAFIYIFGALTTLTWYRKSTGKMSVVFWVAVPLLWPGLLPAMILIFLAEHLPEF